MTTNKKLFSTSISGSAKSYLDSMVESGTPHRVTYTNNSTKIEVGEKSLVFSDIDLTPPELGFIGRVKKEVQNNAEILQIKETSPIFYRLMPGKFRTVERLIEIDISAAFWQTAYKNGLLSHNTFSQGEKVRKEVRLIAFGAAATVRHTFIFDGQNYTEYEKQENQYGRNAYFFVASKISAVLDRICNEIPTAAVLYWVDAIVATPMYKDYVCRSLFEAGFEIKTKVLKDCVFFQESPPTGARVWRVTELESGRVKEFRQYPKKQKNAIFEQINKFLK